MFLFAPSCSRSPDSPPQGMSRCSPRGDSQAPEKEVAEGHRSRLGTCDAHTCKTASFRDVCLLFNIYLFVFICRIRVASGERGDGLGSGLQVALSTTVICFIKGKLKQYGKILVDKEYLDIYYIILYTVVILEIFYQKDLL